MNIDTKPIENCPAFESVASKEATRDDLTEDRVSFNPGSARARELLQSLKAKREHYSNKFLKTVSAPSSNSSSTKVDDDGGAKDRERNNSRKPRLPTKGECLQSNPTLNCRSSFLRTSERSPTNSHCSLDGSDITKHSTGTRSTVATEESSPSMSSTQSFGGHNMINCSIHVMSLPKTPFLHEIRELAHFNTNTIVSPISDRVELVQNTIDRIEDPDKSTCSLDPSKHCIEYTNKDNMEKTDPQAEANEGDLDSLVPTGTVEIVHGICTPDSTESTQNDSAASSSPTASIESDLESDRVISALNSLSMEDSCQPLYPNTVEAGEGHDSELDNYIHEMHSYDNWNIAGIEYASAPPLLDGAVLLKCDASFAANVPLPVSVPDIPTRPPSFDESTSRPIHERPLKLLNFSDVNIPQELVPLVKQMRPVDDTKLPAHHSPGFSRRGHSLEEMIMQSPTIEHASDAGLTMVTLEERQSYLGQLYHRSDASADRLHSPSTTSSTGLRRHERIDINRDILGSWLRTKENATTEKEDAIKTEPSWMSVSRQQKKRRAVHKHRVIETEVLDISIVNDHDKRRELLRRLQEDLQQQKDDEKQGETTESTISRSSSPTSTTSSNFLLISDDSSCDLTTSSEFADVTDDRSLEKRKGPLIVSSDDPPPLPTLRKQGRKTVTFSQCDKTVSLEDLKLFKTSSPVATEQPPQEKLRLTNRETLYQSGRKNISNVAVSVVESEIAPDCDTIIHHDKAGNETSSLSPNIDLTPIDKKAHESKAPRKHSSPKSEVSKTISTAKLLFITGRAADKLCKASGGLYHIAKLSGMTLGDGAKVKLLRLNAGTTTAKPPAFCLSTDFRCGTYGSLYDIAVQSGCNVLEPLPPSQKKSLQSRSKRPSRNGYRSNTMKKKLSNVSPMGIDRKVYLSARVGGSYDTALHCGLSREMLHSRMIVPIMTNVSSSKTTDNTDFIVGPDEISDRRCGAMGSVSISRENSSLAAALLSKSKQALYAIEEDDCVELD